MPLLYRLLACLLLTAAGLAPIGAVAADLNVFASSALADAFKALAPAFEAQNPGARVLLNVAPTPTLLQQLARHVPADVFAATEGESMDEAQRQQLVRPGMRSNFARDSLVVVVPADTWQAPPQSLQGLADDDIPRVVIGDPAFVPSGRQARAALERVQMWDTIDDKSIRAASMPLLLGYLAREEAQAGFAFATDAARAPAQVRVAFTVDTEKPLLYPIAPLAAAAQPALASRFVAFVLSPAGQAVLAKHGLGRP